MPSLKDIQRRIGSVKKTQQITRAMRMVAGAKLRRAQDSIVAARPYADRMRQTLCELAATGSAEHPLLEPRDAVKTVEVIAMTSDRGLCGAFNAGVIRAAETIVSKRETERASVRITTVGRKVRDHFRRHRPDQLGDHTPREGWVTYGEAVDIATGAADRFTSGQVDEVVLLYSEFVTAMTQRPKQVRLLPFDASGDARDDESLPHEFEPSAEKILSVLAPKAVQVEIYRALLETQAGEHAARMTAMESATRNTEELIESLTLQYNRARQAAITKELVEIVSGAEAL